MICMNRMIGIKEGLKKEYFYLIPKKSKTEYVKF